MAERRCRRGARVGARTGEAWRLSADCISRRNVDDRAVGRHRERIAPHAGRSGSRRCLDCVARRPRDAGVKAGGVASRVETRHSPRTAPRDVVSDAFGVVDRTVRSVARHRVVGAATKRPGLNRTSPQTAASFHVSPVSEPLVIRFASPFAILLSAGWLRPRNGLAWRLFNEITRDHE